MTKFVKTKNIENMKYRILFLLMVCIAPGVFAQEVSRHDLASYMDKMSEEVIIHTDRTLYVSGEKVWFSAEYLVNGRKTNPQISNVLYVELFNEDMKPVVQKKYKIENHQVSGMFEIPDGAPTGNYVMRAYTRYQRNFSSWDYAYAQLIVFNPAAKPDKSINENEKDLRIAIGTGIGFPSDSIHYVIALSQVRTRNLDSLLIRDKTDSVVKTVAVPENGLNEFTIPVNDSVEYALHAFFSGGDSLSATLPHPDAQERTLQADLKNGSLRIQVHRPSLEGSAFDGYRIQLYNAAYQRMYETSLSSGEQIVRKQIHERHLRKGLNFVVLRGSNNQITNIRTIYYPGMSARKIDLSFSKENYGPREKVTGEVFCNEPDHKNHLNLAVTVARHGTGSNHRTTLPRFVIANPLLLKDFLNNQPNPSSFKNQIRWALSLFDKEHQTEMKQRLDTVAAPQPDFLPEVRDVAISGVVRNKKTGEPVQNQQVYGSVLFNNPQFHIYETNENGEFVFSLNDLYDLQDVFLCPVQRSEQAKDYEILIEKDFDPRIPKFVKTPFRFESEDKPLLNEILMNYQLDLAFNDSPDEKFTRNGNHRSYYLFGKERISEKMADYIELDEMWDIFYEVIPHVRPVKKHGKYAIKVMNDNSWVLPGKPLILVDNVPVFDVNKIMDMHPSQVEKIEVIDKTYLLGSYAINGVILITTKTDNFGGIKFPEASVFAEYLTLAPKTRYVKVDYNRNKKAPTEPDFRNLLYWNPELKIKEGKARFSFFTSDRKGKYDVIIKGTNGAGRPVFVEKTIVVE